VLSQKRSSLPKNKKRKVENSTFASKSLTPIGLVSARPARKRAPNAHEDAPNAPILGDLLRSGQGMLRFLVNSPLAEIAAPITLAALVLFERSRYAAGEVGS
jgi:hypothetical protein